MAHSIIAIGASAGGVKALRALVSELPETFAAAILVVLHVGAQPSALPAILNFAGRLAAKHGEDGEEILAGRIYVAPPERHMTVAGGRLRLSRGPKVNLARPAIDPLFRSVAENYGPAAVGVILTGRLNDGTMGLIEIAKRGGIAIAQDVRDAAYPEMPASAAAHVALDYSPRLAELAPLLMSLASGENGKDKTMSTSPSPPVIEHKVNPVAGGLFDRPAALTCPDCGGALKRSEFSAMTKFGCHIGHSYTAETMAIAQFEKMERMFRAAIRFLNERAEFCLQMAEPIYETDPALSATWHAASKQALERALKLRDLVEQDWIAPEARQLEPVGE